jgi:hypothetical protein
MDWMGLAYAVAGAIGLWLYNQIMKPKTPVPEVPATPTPIVPAPVIPTPTPVVNDDFLKELIKRLLDKMISEKEAK